MKFKELRATKLAIEDVTMDASWFATYKATVVASWKVEWIDVSRSTLYETWDATNEFLNEI